MSIPAKWEHAKFKTLCIFADYNKKRRAQKFIDQELLDMKNSHSADRDKLS